MARFTEASKNAVIDGVDAVAVAEDYVRLEKRGGRWWGCCPFHQEKTPSFTVDPERKTFKCFGCGKGGSLVSFIMELDKLSFPEAMEALSKRSGIPLQYEEGGGFDGDKAKAKREETEALEELYRRVAVSFHHILMKTPEGEGAKRYILDRGISAETLERFRLGYAPADRSWLHGFLTARGFSAPFLAASGLFSAKYPRSAFFSARLMFPIAGRGGAVAAFGGRILQGDGPKYLNSPESAIFKKGRTLFALDLALPEIRATGEAYLAEGYMDVIALHQGGVSNAVAPLGTAFTDDQAKLLKRWADRVLLMMDSDEAGQNALYKAILCCRKNGLDCSVVDFRGFFGETGSPPKDPAEILQKFGPGALKKSAKRCILDLDFIISRSRVLHKEVSRRVAFLFPYLNVLESEVLRDASIGAVADAFGVERRAVADDLRRFRDGNRQRDETGVNAGPEPRGPFRPGDELYLLAALLYNPGSFRELRTAFFPDDLEDSRARELYIILEDWYRRTGDAPDSPGARLAVVGELLDRIEDGELRDFILRQGSSGAFDNPEPLLNDGMARIKSKALERRRREITRELRNTALDPGRQADLLAEKVHIDAELAGPRNLKSRERS
ncbi:MAG: DNA primase [Treponema sp.]|jgi:DNA primase|nr:DNA primase [Treponema sp.]